MEEPKENKSTIITIVCFILLILGIVGYFAYDMLIKSKKVDRSFDITISEVSLKVNEVKDIKNYIELENIELTELLFTSSDKDIAYVEDTTIVALSKEGIATITATYKKIVKKITVKVGDIKVNTGTGVVTKTDEKIDNDLSEVLLSQNKKSNIVEIDNTTYNLKLLSAHAENIYEPDKLEVNGKVIFDVCSDITSKYVCVNPSIIEVINVGNLLAVTSHISMDIAGYSLSFIDISGNLVKNFEAFDSGNLRFELRSRNNKVIEKVDGNDIYVYFTACTNGPSLLLKDNDIHSTSIFPLSEEEMKKYDINDNTIISGTYKISYLENNEFSNAQLISGETYADFLLNNKISDKHATNVDSIEDFRNWLKEQESSNTQQ